LILEGLGFPDGGAVRGSAQDGRSTEEEGVARQGLAAKGRSPATVARVAGVSRQALYRRPRRAPLARRPPRDGVEELVAEIARANPTDGTRMVAALASQRLGRQLNRKRAQRVMREQGLLQRHRPLRRRRRPGFFRVERPDQLWHLVMSLVWVAKHGWTYLNAAIDCCTRGIVGFSLELRCRAPRTTSLSLSMPPGGSTTPAAGRAAPRPRAAPVEVLQASASRAARHRCLHSPSVRKDGPQGSAARASSRPRRPLHAGR
jgi:putative transposase